MMDNVTVTKVARACAAAVLVASVAWLVAVVDPGALAATGRAVLAEPVPLALALVAYAAAFALRSVAWTALLPSLPLRHAWAALHVSLAANHVLPLRAGEVLRVVSVVRRTGLPAVDVTASTVALRAADVLTVLVLAQVGAAALLAPAGWWLAALAVLGGALLAFAVAVLHARRALPRGRVAVGAVPVTGSAWLAEAAVIWQVATAAGIALTPGEAVAITAVTVAAQALAITPGGFGTYEAVGAAALVAAGAPAPVAVAVALTTHLVKTAYALVLGAVACAFPSPGLLGRLRLARRLPARPSRVLVDHDAPVIAMIPVHDEAATIGQVVRRLPARVAGRVVVPLVVDDGSVDGSADLARAAGARVVVHATNRGLGAAVRTGLAAAAAMGPAAVVYLDGDLEYDPADLPDVVAPVLDGTADYVVGSRFAGRIDRMLARRRFGNRVLTAWVRFTARSPEVTDGQSGYRAFSPAAAAAAEVVHDYNYAQVLTLDLLGKGFVYAEVPISYAFRAHGRSFVRVGRYLRRVVPAVYRELNSA